jgi:hypothetical protein
MQSLACHVTSHEVKGACQTEAAFDLFTYNTRFNEHALCCPHPVFSQFLKLWGEERGIGEKKRGVEARFGVVSLHLSLSRLLALEGDLRALHSHAPFIF